MTSFAKSTATITLFTLLGLCSGFLSNLVIAAAFGAGPDMDAYVAATTLPTLLGAVFGGAVSATFVPLLAEYREKEPGGAATLIGTFLYLVVAAGMVLAVAGMLVAAPLSRALAPGLSEGSLGLSGDLLRWLLPGLVLALVNEVLSGIYYSAGRFFAPMLIKVIGPLVTITSVLLFAPAWSVRSLVLATLAAGLIQTLILAAGLSAGRRLPRILSLDFRNPALRKIGILMPPLVLSLSITRLVPAIDRWLASEMPAGSISLLAYANRLFLVISPLLTTGVSLSGFALMSRLAAREDTEGLKASMTRSLRVLIFFSVPAAALLCAFGRPLVSLVFERGAFSPEDTAMTARLFSIYALSLPATAVGTVIGQGFYVLKDARTPLIVGILEIALYAFLCRMLSPVMGLTAMPVCFNVYFYLSLTALGFLLARRVGFPVFPLFIRPFAFSVLASGVALVPALLLRRIFPESNGWALACLAAAFATYFWVQKRLFHNREADHLLGIFRRKIHA